MAQGVPFLLPDAYATAAIAVTNLIKAREPLLDSSPTGVISLAAEELDGLLAATETTPLKMMDAIQLFKDVSDNKKYEHFDNFLKAINRLSRAAHDIAEFNVPNVYLAYTLQTPLPVEYIDFLEAIKVFKKGWDLFLKHPLSGLATNLTTGVRLHNFITAQIKFEIMMMVSHTLGPNYVTGDHKYLLRTAIKKKITKAVEIKSDAKADELTAAQAKVIDDIDPKTRLLSTLINLLLTLLDLKKSAQMGKNYTGFIEKYLDTILVDQNDSKDYVARNYDARAMGGFYNFFNPKEFLKILTPTYFTESDELKYIDFVGGLTDLKSEQHFTENLVITTLFFKLQELLHITQDIYIRAENYEHKREQISKHIDDYKNIQLTQTLRDELKNLKSELKALGESVDRIVKRQKALRKYINRTLMTIPDPNGWLDSAHMDIIMGVPRKTGFISNARWLQFKDRLIGTRFNFVDSRPAAHERDKVSKFYETPHTIMWTYGKLQIMIERFLDRKRHWDRAPDFPRMQPGARLVSRLISQIPTKGTFIGSYQTPLPTVQIWDPAAGVYKYVSLTDPIFKDVITAADLATNVPVQPIIPAPVPIAPIPIPILPGPAPAPAPIPIAPGPAPAPAIPVAPLLNNQHAARVLVHNNQNLIAQFMARPAFAGDRITLLQRALHNVPGHNYRFTRFNPRQQDRFYRLVGWGLTTREIHTQLGNQVGNPLLPDGLNQNLDTFLDTYIPIAHQVAGAPALRPIVPIFPPAQPQPQPIQPIIPVPVQPIIPVPAQPVIPAPVQPIIPVPIQPIIPVPIQPIIPAAGAGDGGGGRGNPVPIIFLNPAPGPRAPIGRGRGGPRAPIGGGRGGGQPPAGGGGGSPPPGGDGGGQPPGGDGGGGDGGGGDGGGGDGGGGGGRGGGGRGNRRPRWWMRDDILSDQARREMLHRTPDDEVKRLRNYSFAFKDRGPPIQAIDPDPETDTRTADEKCRELQAALQNISDIINTSKEVSILDIVKTVSRQATFGEVLRGRHMADQAYREAQAINTHYGNAKTIPFYQRIIY